MKRENKTFKLPLSLTKNLQGFGHKFSVISFLLVCYNVKQYRAGKRGLLCIGVC